MIAFLFADLIVLPILAIYRKYYGTAFALRITALMFVTMVLAALIVDGLFSVARARSRTRARRTRRHLRLGRARLQARAQPARAGVFAALFALTVRRGATDPVCGMTVDRAQGADAARSTGERSTSARSTAATRTRRRARARRGPRARALALSAVSGRRARPPASAAAGADARDAEMAAQHDRAAVAPAEAEARLVHERLHERQAASAVRVALAAAPRRPRRAS